MTVHEVRSKYLEFFRKRDHRVVPSAPIVPGNDPTTLFTSSGMQPMIPYLLGKDHPEGKRIVDSQLSFRAGDIEEVGDNRHTTFFEMLGNWSLGDYFKESQLPWIFEFLTEIEDGLGLDASKLYVTVFAGEESIGIPKDHEAIALWKKLFTSKGIEAKDIVIGSEENGYAVGMQGGRIFAYDAKKNWWSRAGTPDKMPAGEPGGPDSEMFYDFGTPHNPKWGKHCHLNCDCGRFVEIGNSVFMEYIKNSDGTFAPLPKRNIDFGGGLERIALPTGANSDVFMLDVFEDARKVLASRTGQEYKEDEKTIRAWRIILDHIRAAAFMLAEGVLPSNTEAGYVLRRLIRRSIREADRLGIKDNVLAEVAEGFGVAYAVHYPHVLAHAGTIRTELALEEEKFRKTLIQGLREFEKLSEKGGITGEEAFVLFTTYGFPYELAQEVAKEKSISINEGAFKKAMQRHQDTSRAGGAQRFAGGLADHSEQTVRYHTTHHLLLRALQEVLGKEVHQRGSNITSERLRIDFSYGAKMTAEQKAEVEKLVNEKIAEELPVIRSVIPKAEAEKLGAEHEFGVKYPEMVSVYSVGPKNATEENPRFNDVFSLEFCGGPHVQNTKEIGEGGRRFKIQKEEAVAAGIRRIKGVLE
jgi:alanyl-tRNA synthetase